MINLHKRTTDFSADSHKLADDLRVALMTQQLQVAFQPKVCSQTQKTVGAEVLLRWQHPVEGLISADRWVCIAEDHNLMRPLTVWLIDEVISHLKSAGESALPLAINVSPTILDGAFSLHIVKSIAKAKINPQLLEIEITESAPVANMTNLANAVRLLQSKGHKVYLDDFGTGYSTMQYLVDVPVDGVKMDKGFVQQAPLIPAARMVLRTLIELANEIGVTVVCEGVETLEQFTLVKRLGAQVIQGYLTGKPMSAQDYAKRLDATETPIFLEVEVDQYKLHAS